LRHDLSFNPILRAIIDIGILIAFAEFLSGMVVREPLYPQMHKSDLFTAYNSIAAATIHTNRKEGISLLWSGR
jgi:hypothetical protein